MRCQRSGNQLTSTRSVMRNHMPAETALQIAARMLILTATELAIGRIENTRPMMTKSGYPEGWGMPSVYAAAMYSLVSHMAVDGASVIRYNTSVTSETTRA